MKCFDENGKLTVYCDNCDKECTDNYETFDDMDLCNQCINENSKKGE